MITRSEFDALAARGYNRIPLVLGSFADLDTPLSLYLKLAQGPRSYLLESVVGGERFGRYSFIGLPSKLALRAHGTRIEVEDAAVVVERHEGDPLEFVRAFMARYRAAPWPGLPRFCGGLAGYFGYDTVRHVEPRLAASAPRGSSALDELPEILLLLIDYLCFLEYVV
jgi:anthranilate synthase component 1